MGHEKIDAALEANKVHQTALTAYIERLQAELETVDGLLAIASIESVASSDSEADDDVRVHVPGAAKPASLLLPRELLTEGGLFMVDARWKRRYDDLTNTTLMKAREHEALREAVRAENRSLHALRSEVGIAQTIDDLSRHPPEFFEQNMVGLDFRRIAIKMNDLIPGGVKHTELECEIRWRGHLHPSFNHGIWPPDETTRLHGLVAEAKDKGARPDWVHIAKDLGKTGRTPLDCMRRATTRRIYTWSKNADRALEEAVEVYGQNNWQLVAMHVSEDATAHQCQKRFADTVDPSVRGGPWTAEEDDRLRHAIAAFATEGALPTGSPAPETTAEPEIEADAEAEDPARGVTGTKGKGKETAGAKVKGKSKEKVQVSWQDVALFVPGRTNNQCRERYERVLVRGGDPPKMRGGGRRRGEVKSQSKANAPAKSRRSGRKGRVEAKESGLSTAVGSPSISLPGSESELDQAEGTRTSLSPIAPQRAERATNRPSQKTATVPPPAQPEPQKRPQPRPRPRRKLPSSVPADTSQPASAAMSEPAQATSRPTAVRQPSIPINSLLRSPIRPRNRAPPPPLAAPQTRPPTRARPQRRATADTRKRKRTFATESSSDGEQSRTNTGVASQTSPRRNARTAENANVGGLGSSPLGVRRSSRLAGAVGRA